MPIVDYRTIPFQIVHVGDSGKYMGRTMYWKLYVLENTVRVLIHSVLTVQINPNWWGLAVRPDTIRKVQNVKRSYARKPHHTNPGRHDLYYVFLPDLVDILRTNSPQFLPYIPDIDQWIIRLENIQLPRNIVGHMNWLNNADKQLINTTYFQLKALLRRMQLTGLNLLIP